MYETAVSPPWPARLGTSPRPSAAVVGAAGFIGRPLADALQAEGVRVARFTRARPAVRDGRLHPELWSARTVFFVAGSIDPARAEGDGRLAAAADRRLLVDLLEGLRATGRRPVLAFAASGGTVYDPAAEPPYRETAPTGPTIAYGRCKLRMERELLARADAVHPVILRLANIYGPGQPERGGVVARWLARVARGEPLEIFGSPRAARDYLYVDDAVDALLRVRHRFADGTGGDRLPSVVNIGSGTPVTLAHLTDVVSVAVGRPLQVRFIEGRHIDRLAYWLDISAADRLLRWRPRTPLLVGVRRAWLAQCGQPVPHLAAATG
jgi:UDP-glucose 4-epimerase